MFQPGDNGAVQVLTDGNEDRHGGVLILESQGDNLELEGSRREEFDDSDAGLLERDFE